MNKPEVDINIEDIYYKQDEQDTLDKKLLGNPVNGNSYCCYNFIESSRFPPRPNSMIFFNVESLTSLMLFSILEIYDFVVPTFSASCSCVIPFSSLAS